MTQPSIFAYTLPAWHTEIDVFNYLQFGYSLFQLIPVHYKLPNISKHRIQLLFEYMGFYLPIGLYFFLNVFNTLPGQIALTFVNLTSTIQIPSCHVSSNLLLSLLSQPSGKSSPCLPYHLFSHFYSLKFLLLP